MPHRISKQIHNEILQKDNFLLVAHQNPDGDAASAVSAFSQMLEQLGKKYTLFCKTSVSDQFEYLKNIYGTIVYRDIINRFAVRNVPFLEQVVLFLAGNIGSIFSAKKISDFLKSQKTNIPPNQVQIYSHYLISAFLVHRVARYDMIGKRIFEIGEKYYLNKI
jgi:predicted AAA+ superfamily ATPase